MIKSITWGANVGQTFVMLQSMRVCVCMCVLAPALRPPMGHAHILLYRA